MARRGLDGAAVVDAAARIADAEGVAAVTLARIAADLGVRPPSLYNHVDGRAGVLRGLVLRGAREVGAAMRDAAVGRSGAAALTAMAAAYRSYAREHPGLYAALVAAPPEGDDELEATAAETVAVITAVLAAWDLEGEEAIHATRGVRSALHGFVALELGGGFGLPIDVDDSFDRLVRLLVSGLDGGLVGGGP